MHSSALGICVIAFCAISVNSLEHWSVFSGTTNVTYCLIVESEPSGSITFDNGNETRTHDFTFGNANVTGKCFPTFKDMHANIMTVEFYPIGINYTYAWKLELAFAKDTESSFILQDWTLTTVDMFNDTTFEKDGTIDFGAVDDHAFMCSTVTLSFKGGENKASVKLDKIRALPFAALEEDEFPKDTQFQLCKLDSRTSVIVPIIVGGFLAGLVAAVLVAYMIGRARARSQGYASV